ncbi:ABC transporter substrate-binding protein [Coxiella endosymbiont of Ornithodoros maritimus]|uniref:ABC transporter substrate-binding protein n=1 Tax=Coxiella endosymbiont of Ornithodoros maritimus TaxID=1656172 RepID=UPI00226485CC|nr:ABC transporter substrate-binding protein [Coxiella endosymbiont of Ornithodoros maritimus]
MQDYYDKSRINIESFAQAIAMDREGKPYLRPELIRMGVRLQTTVVPEIFYIGFNMLAPIVGDYSEKKKKLRQAIAIALDYEEFISIFHNGRGIPAQGARHLFLGTLRALKVLIPMCIKMVRRKTKKTFINTSKRIVSRGRLSWWG